MRQQKYILLGSILALIFSIAYWSIAHSGPYTSNPDISDVPSTMPEAIPVTTVPESTSTIQVALLLDTSSSMSGLIEQTKSQLWNILNQLAKVTKDGEEPNLEIALYEYGNPGRATEDMQIHQLTNFTSDVDAISEQLFALRTDGGEEYCGAVIQSSLNKLEWNDRPENLKMIYIAGNEPFNQGPIDFKKVCGLANEKNVVINTIFCGGQGDRDSYHWKTGAQLGKGVFAMINHNEATVYVETPYDDQINQLNTKLNDTYVPFGKEGKQKKYNQSIQDANAQSYSKANFADRSAYKSSKKYKAEKWDLVDAYKKDKKILSEATALPDSLQSISIQEMEKQIQEIAQRREKIQQEIRDLNGQRQNYIQQQKEKKATSSSLENSILQSIEKQAKLKGFEIKE